MGDKKLLNSRRNHTLEEIRNNPNVTQAQLPQIIGIGLSVIENNIGFLKIKQPYRTNRLQQDGLSES